MKISARGVRVFGTWLTLVCVLALGGIIFVHGTAVAQTDREPDGGGTHVFLPLIGGPGAQGAQDAGGEPPVPVLPVPFTSSPYLLPDPADQLEAARAKPPAYQSAKVKLIIDTDGGVDDAVAIDWLLSQNDVPVEVLGAVSAAGNGYVTDATKVTQIVLQQLRKSEESEEIGVVEGVSRPLQTKSNFFLFGPDGLWGLTALYPDGSLPEPGDSATEFYCATMEANPGVTILALGPLTNIAAAIAQCPNAMATAQMVILGGSKYGGNKTPNAEHNFWQDPGAVEIVLNTHMAISPTIVLLDAFSQASFDMKDLDQLFGPGETNKANAATQFLEPAIRAYADAQIANLEGGRALIPDAVAAVVALDPSVAAVLPARVEIISAEDDGEPSLTRGQSIIGLSFAEKFGMIATETDFSTMADVTFEQFPPYLNYDGYMAEIGRILYGAMPLENAIVVTAVDPKLLTHRVFPDLREK